MALVIIKESDSGSPVLSGTIGAMIGLLDAGLIVNHVVGTSDDVTFTNQSVEARLEGGTAFNLLLTNVTGARLYIGMPSRFFRAKFDLATLGIGGTYVFEYWNGAAWTTFVPSLDGTSGFTADGTVTWTAGLTAGWATVAVNTVGAGTPVTQFWIRIRASVTPGTNPTINFVTVSGWTKAFAGTNLASYRQGTGSNGFFLHVDDTGAGGGPVTTAREARVTGFESMTSFTFASGTAPFPTAIQTPSPLIWNKSGALDATSRTYVLAVSEKLFHLAVNGAAPPGLGINISIYAFGDIRSYKSGDAFHTIIVGSTVAAAAAPVNNHMNVLSCGGGSPGHFMSRSFTQIGASITCSKTSDGSKGSTSNMGGSGLAYPHAPDGGLYLAPLWVHESSSVVRGELPGIWNPLHSSPLINNDTFSGTGPLAGRTFMAIKQDSNAQAFLETSDTWTI